MRIAAPRRVAFALAAVVVLAALPVAFDADARAALGRAVDLLTLADTGAAVAGFRDYLASFGPFAAVVSALLMIFQSVIAPLPAFVITFANGLLFGWLPGALLSWASGTAGAALCFWIARPLGRPLVERLVGGSRALETADLFFERYGDKAVLVARLLPFVSFDLVSYAAGLTAIGFPRFLVSTALGQIPATLVYSYLGQSATGSVTVLFVVFAIALALVVVAGAAGPHVLRRLRAGAAAARSPDRP